MTHYQAKFPVLSLCEMVLNLMSSPSNLKHAITQPSHYDQDSRSGTRHVEYIYVRKDIQMPPKTSGTQGIYT